MLQPQPTSPANALPDMSRLRETTPTGSGRFGAPFSLQDIEAAIASRPLERGNILVSAILFREDPSEVRHLAERYIYTPGHVGLAVNFTDLLALLLSLQGVRGAFNVQMGSIGRITNRKHGAAFLALVGVIERLPQPRDPPHHEHFINTQIADALLHNAAGTRRPDGLWMNKNLGWDLDGMELLLQGIDGNRFSRTAVEKAIGAMFSHATTVTVSANFGWRLGLLRNLLARAHRDWFSGPACIDRACTALWELYGVGIRPYIVDHATEDPPVTFRQFRGVVDAFRDAGLVFYAKESMRIDVWLRQDVQSASAQLQLVMSSPEPWTFGVERHAHKYGIAQDLLTLLNQIIVPTGGVL